MDLKIKILKGVTSSRRKSCVFRLENRSGDEKLCGNEWPDGKRKSHISVQETHSTAIPADLELVPAVVVKALSAASTYKHLLWRSILVIIHKHQVPILQHTQHTRCNIVQQHQLKTMLKTLSSLLKDEAELTRAIQSTLMEVYIEQNSLIDSSLNLQTCYTFSCWSVISFITNTVCQHDNW